MRGIRVGRGLAWCVVGCLVGLFAWVGLSTSGGGSGASALADTSGAGGVQNLSLDSLVVPAMEGLEDGELGRDQRHARLLNPEAVTGRALSRTEFEHLDTAQAVRIAGKTFPGVVNKAAGGPPGLPTGERIIGYVARNAAAVALPGGKHGVIESLQPIATSSGHGRFTPIDLGLHAGPGGYVPANSDVAVRIPKQVTAGVQMPGDGVSLTPMNAQGQPLDGSEGAQEGASVVYANTQTDTDTLAKPTTGGFEIDSLLRSADSPETLYFKVKMPAGARLVSDKGPDGARVVLHGRTIAGVAPPSAEDAEGTSVPVRMGVVGSTLVVSVAHDSSEYRYPIVVDPRAYDYQNQLPSNCNNYSGERTNWEFHYSGGGFECYSSGVSPGYAVVMSTVGGVNRGEYDELRYPAHGQASVTFVEGEMAVGASSQSGAVTKIEFIHENIVEPYEKTVEREFKLTNAGESFSRKLEYECDQPVIEEGVSHCRALNNENELRITQTDTATENVPEGYGFWFELYNGTWVSLFQGKGPEVSFNTAEEIISEASGRSNVLYGSGGWLGEDNGAVAITAKDPGLGVSDVKIQDLTAGPHGEHWKFNQSVYEEHLCTGVWCNNTYKTHFTYNKEMAEGANTFELCAEDEALMKTCSDATVYIDNTPPHEIKLSGLVETGAEINATQHQVTVEATDGTKPNSSSGMKSITVSVDGKEIVGPSAKCLPGECTARGTWTIDGESLGAGEHKLEIVATDNAGNVSPSSTKVVTFAIRNATPVKLGPGTIDPVTGQFALSANDVSMAGAGGISRGYDSRSPAANLESPLGSQWKLNAGTGQSLKLLPDGSVELQGPGGEPTIFASNGEGGFEAPKGDSSLALEAKEKEAEKGITEYLLKDPAAGTTTTFTRPLEEGQFVIPTYFGKVGMVGSGSGQLLYASQVAVGPKGNIWVIDNGNYRVVEFNRNREFIMAFGYGVSNGARELQTCTTSCRSGIEGESAGMFFGPRGIAVGSNGNIWITDGARIEEFNEKGGFLGEFGRAKYNYGEGSGEVNNPNGIAVDSKNHVWVVDSGNNRVDEFNEKQEFAAAFGFGVTDGANKLEVCTTTCRKGGSGSENGEFNQPVGVAVRNGYIWVADNLNNRIEKFTEKYEYVTQFGKSGIGNGEFSLPHTVAVDEKGDVWVADWSKRIQEFGENGGYKGQLNIAGTGEPLFPYSEGGVTVDGEGNVVAAMLSSVDEWSHSTWLPTKTVGTASDDTRATSYRSVMVEGNAVTEPIEELGPVPVGVTCGKNPAEVGQAELSARLAELKAGCRALSFTYAEKTTATGEGSSGWGEYNGRLMKVSFTAYNPAVGVEKMETKVVAEYAYDNKGRLRAEWDPRVSPALKTTYGYDAEGHVTALTPAGLESWAFTYGAIAGDPSTGRLLKVTRAPASATLWKGELPKYTGAPTLSGSLVVGITMGVSKGAWSNSPVTYAYQWERCNSKGAECVPIEGATNANYKLTTKDAGHTLYALVTATNGGGSVASSTTVSAEIKEESEAQLELELLRKERVQGEHYGPEPGSTVEYHVPLSGSSAPYQMTSVELAKWGQTKDEPGEATAIFPPDEPQGWPAGDYKRATIIYMDGQARTTNTASPSGAISTAEYNSLNEVTRTLSAADRALALKEGSKSAEVAKALSSEKIYHDEGAQLFETFGPEHKIKLPNGTEEGTRDRQQFSYNEGAPSKGETYDLPTRALSWMEGAGNKELEMHEKTLSYSDSAQGEAGWTLRKPILVTEKVKEHTSTETTAYSSETGNVLESATSMSTKAPVSVSQFGSNGSGNGQFNQPAGVAIDASGNVWVTDDDNNRIQKFSPAGVFVGAYGSKGTAAGQFEGAWGIAINKVTGNVYVTDTKNDRVQEFSSSGAFVRTFGYGVSNGETKFEICTSSCHAGVAGSGSGQFYIPTGITVDPSGNVWVVDDENNRVEEFKENGEYLSRFGSKGTGNGQFIEPEGIAISDGDVYVTDTANNRVEEFSSLGTYLSQWGTKGTGSGQFHLPLGITTDPVSGALLVADRENSRVEEFSRTGIFLTEFGSYGTGEGHIWGAADVAVTPAGSIYVADKYNDRVDQWEPVPSAPIYTAQFGNTGSESEKLSNPANDALDAHGNLWVASSYGHRIEEFSASGAFLHSYGSYGTEGGHFNEPVGVAVNQSTGNVYVGDQNNNRVDELNEKGEFVETFGWGVSNGKEEFEICTSGCRAGTAGSGAGQFKETGGVALDAKGDIWVTDYSNSRIQEFSSSGAFIEAVGFGVSNGEEKAEVCTSNCRAGVHGSGNGQLNGPSDLIVVGGNVYVTDENNSRVEEFNEKGEYVQKFGSYGTGKGEFHLTGGIGSDAAGNLYVADILNNRVEEFTPSGTFLAAFGSKGSGNGQFAEPAGVAVSPTGTIYAADSGNNRIQEWAFAPRPGNEGARNINTIYYSVAANAEYPGCGKHPEWANLACQTGPIAQPGDSGPPPLPVTTITAYNIWNEPETAVEQIGSVTRTIKRKYDSAGREIENEKTSTSSENAALPVVKDEYSTETGAMVKLKQTLEGKEKTLTSVYNTLGQLASYTDAEGSTTKYSYDIDGRVEEVSEPKGKQIYAYDPTTGFLTKLLDSAAGTFTATYGVSGEMLTEGYPNGMTAKYTHNSIGQATNLEYEKTTDCSSKCVWFSDSDAYGPKGKLATQTSTLSSESYGYSEDGQLSQTEETPVGGKGCITRQYGYNETTGERTSVATREPNEKGECTTEGGLIEGHAYDVVGRLLDPGVAYDALGNMTKTPALDAGGSPITSSFYVDSQVATQEQSEKTIAYSYDPAGRTMIAKLTGKSGSNKTISHYAGPGEALTWTCEEEEGKKECEEAKETKWTRNIPGIDGALDAIQANGGTPVLELHDLEGNVVATASLSETATELISTHNNTEFGVPVGKAPKYSWLGADGAESELETGVISKAGATYVPQLAGMLQTEGVVPPGAAPNGVMTTQAYSPPELGWANQSGSEAAANTVAEQRAIEREEEESACRADPESCSGDPSWSGDVSIAEARTIALAMEGLEGLYYLTGGEFAKKVVGDLKNDLGVDFVSQVQEAIEKGLFGFSTDQVVQWAFDLGGLLSTCAESAEEGRDNPKHPHCWVFFYTVIRHNLNVYKQPWWGQEIPNFGVEPEVGYCPWGTNSKCLIVNDF